MTNSIRWKSLSLPLLNCSFYCILASHHQMTSYIEGNQFRQRPVWDVFVYKRPHKTVTSNLIYEFAYDSWQWSYIGDFCVLLWHYQKFAVEWVGCPTPCGFDPPLRSKLLSLWWMTLPAKVWLETPCVCPLENGLAKWSSPLLHTVKDDQLWSLLCVLWPTTWITSNPW